MRADVTNTTQDARPEDLYQVGTLTMIKQYRAGKVPQVVILENVAAQIATATDLANAHYAKYEFSRALVTP